MSGASSTSLRQPPANLVAEQRIIGAILANNNGYDRVADILTTEHFADAAHARIFSTIAKRISQGLVADAVALRAQFAADGDLQEVGGMEYLADLIASQVGLSNIRQYAEMVVDCFLRRGLIESCEDAIAKAYLPPDEIGALSAIADLDGRLLAMRANGDIDGVKAGPQVAEETIAHMQAMRQRGTGLAGITTGFESIDDILGGLAPEAHIVLGARSSMGKTALGAAIAVGAAQAGAKVFFLTCEMAPKQILARITAGHAQVPLTAVTRGIADRQPISAEMAARIAEKAWLAGKLPIQWDSASSPTVAEIRARCRTMKRRQGLDLIVIDYLQLLRASPEATRRGRYEAVGEISKALKAMARDLQVPVLTLSQLNRGVEGRDDQRPRMSDLRDSGAIEEDADAIALLYREHYYLMKSKPTHRLKETLAQFDERTQIWNERCDRAKGKAELDFSKNRQGRTGIVNLGFEDVSAWFRSLTDQEMEDIKRREGAHA